MQKNNGDLREYLKQNLKNLELSKDVVKYALHGFWGDLYTMFELYALKGTEYIVRHMTKIKESMKQRKQPRIMETRRRHMRVDWKRRSKSCRAD